MKYFIDTNKIEEIKKWKKKLGKSFAGVTTNTTMIKTKEEIFSFLEEMKKEFSFDDFDVMIQIDDYDIMLEIKKRYNNIIIKTPMIEDNFNFINESIKFKRTAATTCYSLIQINQAIELEMDYSMVYYAKNKYKGLLEDAVKLKKDANSNIKLVAASIHTPEEVIHALKTGIEYVTVRPDVLELLFNPPQSIKDLANG